MSGAKDRDSKSICNKNNNCQSDGNKAGERVKDLFQVNELLIFAQTYSSFVNYIYNFLNDDNPKIFMGVLFILGKFGALPISHIGEKLYIAKSNMTFIINALVKKKLVRRVASTTDRRVTNIELTDEGKSYVDDSILKLNDILRDKLSILTGDEKDEAVRSLNLIISVIGKIII